MDNVTPEQRTAIAAQMRNQLENASPDAYRAQQLGYMRKVGTLDPKLAETVAPLNARSDQKAVARYMSEDAAADFRPALKHATLPILEISPYNAADFSAGPSRHYVMLDQPAAFQKTLVDFVNAH
ncbi:hypothetical protein [Luteibacter yeojuensis]|uniref:Alpha/beta hydrolase family protein n=1 Tax=Luteibacter yeojuensis TaxID=345309 RepID=A0A7X5QY19_9GAMM|nr:hypothetical protein [Luteibacter yeojuensis]NID17412.1 hypothetical protein [Luteibacter yeojuensis]